MALSGTLETFSLPDVLRLLSSTKKTGLLALDGDRGRGRIWVRDGAIVGAQADRAVREQVDGVAFELLRFADGGFEFHSGEETADEGDARDVDDVLAEAEARLAEWREIEAVVPSLDVWVRMVAELDAERPVTPTQWRVLAQVGTGTRGHDLAERLGQGEYDVCRQLRDLIGDGMVQLDDAPAAPVAEVTIPAPEAEVEPAWDYPADEPTFVEPALDPDAVSSLGADLASFVAVGTVSDPVAPEQAADEPETEPEPDLAATDTWSMDELDGFEPVEEPIGASAEPSPVDEADEADEDDFLSQLSQLSPKAAAAVEATWAGDVPAPAVEAEPVAEGSEAGDLAPEPAPEAEIDQNLLLRFLSSTTKP